MIRALLALAIWLALAIPATATENCVVSAIAGGTGDAITVPLLPCTPTSNLLVLTLTGTNTTTSPTLQVLGTPLPAATILQSTGAPVQVGQLQSGSKVLLTFNGTNWFTFLGAALPLVENTGQLSGLASTAYSSVQRLGYATAGDAPPLQFASSSNSCTAHSGAGDGGGCVPASDGGSWTATHPASGVDVRQFGCKLDGVTDNAVCMQDAADYVGQETIGFVSGPLVIPSGALCTKSTINFDHAGVMISGAGVSTTFWTACGADITLVSANAPRITFNSMFLAGTNLITASHDTLFFGANCTGCKTQDMLITYGLGAHMSGADQELGNTEFYNIYGSSMVKFDAAGGGGWIIRSKLDNPYPYAIPATGSIAAVPVRAAGTPIVAGDIVSNAGFYLQATAAGTTSLAVTLTNLPYGTPIPDGTVVWQLVCSTSLQALINSSSILHSHESDYTGAVVNSMLITGGVFYSDSDTMGSNLGSGIVYTGGGGGSVTNVFMSNGATTGSEGISIGTAFAGDLEIKHPTIIGYVNGIDIGAGKNYQIIAPQIFGMTGTAIIFHATANHFSVIGGNLGTSSQWGTNVNTIATEAIATVDYCIFSGIVLNGATNPAISLGAGSCVNVANGTGANLP